MYNDIFIVYLILFISIILFYKIFFNFYHLLYILLCFEFLAIIFLLLFNILLLILLDSYSYMNAYILVFLVLERVTGLRVFLGFTRFFGSDKIHLMNLY